MELDAQTVKKIVKEELPGLMKRDKNIRRFILELSKEQFTETREKTVKLEKETGSRFELLLDDLRKDREEQTRKWEEQNKKWEEQNKRLEEQNKRWEGQDKKWEEQNKRWEEQNKRWERQDKKWEEQNKRLEEQNKKWEEQDKKWEEQNKRWEEQNKKWEENQEEIRKLYRAFTRKHDTTLGALGARWGIRSEESFRNALKDILKDFDITVLNIKEYDGEGEVFGRPADIELDIIITNGTLMISELKSAMSRADMFAFYKKAKFYEKIHNREADRLIVISPMVDDKAREVSRELGIKIYSYAEEMEEDIANERSG
jgi:hypothetical protein